MTNVMCHINNKLVKKERKIMGKIITKTIQGPSGKSLKVEFEFNTEDRGFTMSNEINADQFIEGLKGITASLNKKGNITLKEKNDANDVVENIVDGFVRFKDELESGKGAKCKVVFSPKGKSKCYINDTKIYEYIDKKNIDSFIDGVRQLYLGGELIGPGEKRF